VKDVSFENPARRARRHRRTFGSGKTTLLGLLAGLDTPSRGQVLYDAVDITRLDEMRARDFAASGWVSSSRASSSFRRSRRSRMCRCARIAGRGECGRPGERPPQPRGLGDRLDHFPTQLSGGTAAGCHCEAFVNAPRILFADEPTGNLDSETGAKIVQLIEELNKSSGSTVVIVTHDASLARGRIASSAERRPRGGGISNQIRSGDLLENSSTTRPSLSG